MSSQTSPLDVANLIDRIYTGTPQFAKDAAYALVKLAVDGKYNKESSRRIMKNIPLHRSDYTSLITILNIYSLDEYVDIVNFPFVRHADKLSTETLLFIFQNHQDRFAKIWKDLTDVSKQIDFVLRILPIMYCFTDFIMLDIKISIPVYKSALRNCFANLHYHQAYLLLRKNAYCRDYMITLMNSTKSCEVPFYQDVFAYMVAPYVKADTRVNDVYKKAFANVEKHIVRKDDKIIYPTVNFGYWMSVETIITCNASGTCSAKINAPPIPRDLQHF